MPWCLRVGCCSYPECVRVFLKKPSPLSTYAEAQRYALGLLSRRDRTSFELRSKLNLRLVPLSVQDQVMDFLVAKGWVNDQRSAESFASSRKAMGWGPTKIRSAFFKRGIPSPLADKALSAEFGGEAEAVSALRLLGAHQRRFLASNRVPKPKGPEKALSFLLRRGFSYSSSRLAVQKVFSYNPELPEEE